MFDKRTPIEPGLLDRLVTVQELTESVGTSGFPVETWADMADVWMGRSSLKGMERIQAGQLAARYDARWMMHYRADMDPDLVDVPKKRRLLFQGRYHDVVDAQHIGRKEGVEVSTIASTAVS
jgi:SPP1 family predicted phage head-tail adaptor